MDERTSRKTEAMNKLIPIPSFFASIRTLADGSLRASFDTQELRDEVANELFAKRRKSGFLIFLENAEKVDLTDLDIPEVAPEFKGEKTPSQRLRGVLYILWQQTGSEGNFQDFYIGKMETITNQIKSRLV